MAEIGHIPPTLAELPGSVSEIPESVAATAEERLPMHLEDVTELPLKFAPRRLYTMATHYLSDLGEQVAAQSVGQFVIHKVEDGIWAVEKSIEWAAPSEPKKAVKPKGEERAANGPPQPEPAPEGAARPSRPLPWIFFIPVLVMWRGTRLAYETASSLLGKPPVQPDHVVVFLRNRRRGLRALRVRGKRTMKTLVDSPTVLSKVTSFFNPLVVVLNNILGLFGLTPRKESKRDLEVSTRPLPAGEDNADENVLEKLNRLSRDPDNSQDDPDFEPDSSVSSEESSSSSADASEEEKEVSTPVITDADDVANINTDARSPPRTSSFITEIIEEEDEGTVVTDLDSPSSIQTLKTVDDASEDACEDGDFASVSSARSSEVFTDTCDSNNSSVQQIPIGFKQGLMSHNSC